MTELAYLIEGCRQNNRVSQEKLYMQCYPALYALCRRFFDDEQEIVTAINNGMLRVFKNISQYDAARSALPTWIYSIVRNEALTVVRNKNSAVVIQELGTELSAEINSNPFAHSAADEVVQYLAKLPNTARAACSLFYLEGYSIKEISLSLQIKEGTVKWHLSDGRKRLQAIFKINGTRIAKTPHKRSI